MRHGAWRWLESIAQTVNSGHPTPRPLPPQGPQQYQPLLPGSIQALSSRPASGAPSLSPAAGLEDRQVLGRGQRPPESRPHGWRPRRKRETWTQTQRSHVEMGAGTAEMLLRAEDRPPPPEGRGRAPLGSGLGGPRRRHSGPGEAALSADGPRLCQEGDSHTARGSISRTAVVGRGRARGLPGTRREPLPDRVSMRTHAFSPQTADGASAQSLR